MKSKYKVLLIDTLIFAIGGFGSKILLFLLLPLYTNVLSDSEYGIADLVFTIGQLVLPFVSLTIYNGLIRFGLDKKESKENVILCSMIVFLLGSLLAVAIFPLLTLYKPIENYAFYIPIYVIASFASTNCLSYLKVKNKNKTFALLSICQAALLVLCNLLFLLVIRLKVEGYLLSTIISTGVIAIVAFFCSGMVKDLRIAHLDSKLFKNIIIFSLPFILNDISWWFIHSSDKIMIEWMISSAALGLYTAASKIPSLINVFASIFSQAWGISSIKEYDRENDTSFYSNVFNYFSLCIFGLCIAIIAIVKVFMKFYVGQEFFDSWRFVPLLLLSATFSSVSAFAGSMFGAMKKSKTIMYTTIIAGVANIALNYIFIRLVGVWGAVIGTVSSYALIALIRMVVVYRNIKIDYHLYKFIPLCLLTTAEAILVGLDFNPLVVGISSIVVFLIIANKDLLNIARLITKKIKGKKEE